MGVNDNRSKVQHKREGQEDGWTRGDTLSQETLPDTRTGRVVHTRLVKLRPQVVVCQYVTHLGTPFNASTAT